MDTLAPASRGRGRGARTRSRLLEAARELFARRGYEGTSIGDVAEAAEIGVGTVYHHFEDKRSLLLAVLELYEGLGLAADEEGGGLGVALAADDPKAGILGLVRAAVQLRRAHPSVFAIGQAVGRRDPEVAACCAGIEDRHRARLRGAIETGQASGKVRPEMDPASAAFFVHQLSFTTVTRISELPAGPEADRLTDEYAALLQRYLLS